MDSKTPSIKDEMSFSIPLKKVEILSKLSNAMNYHVSSSFTDIKMWGKKSHVLESMRFSYLD